jgi:hypothetical protein
MAKIIEFYIPTNFRKAEKVTAKTRGQLIEFASARKKSA